MELIDLIEKLESRINTYWNFYTVVIFANAGWVFHMYGGISFMTASLLSVGLILFFISNLSFQKAALVELSVPRDELRSIKDPFPYKKLQETYSKESIPFRYSGTFILHISVDVLLIVIIFSGVK